MTLDRNKLKELCEKATKGPWEWWSGNPWHANAPNHPLRNEGDNPPQVFQTGNANLGFFYRPGVQEQAKHDTEFIAEARTALPELLAELEAAERVVEEKTRLTYAMEERVRELTQHPTKCPKGHPVPYQGCKYCGMLGDFSDAKRVELIEIIFKWHDAFYREENRANAEHSRLSVMETALRKISAHTCGCMSPSADNWHSETCFKSIAIKALSDQGGNNGA